LGADPLRNAWIVTDPPRSQAGGSRISTYRTSATGPTPSAIAGRSFEAADSVTNHHSRQGPCHSRQGHAVWAKGAHNDRSRGNGPIEPARPVIRHQACYNVDRPRDAAAGRAAKAEAPVSWRKPTISDRSERIEIYTSVRARPIETIELLYRAPLIWQ